MAVFTYSEEAIQHLLYNGARRRKWVYSFAAAWLAVDFAVAFGQLFWPAIRINFPARWVNLVFVVPLILIFSTFRTGKDLIERVKAHLRSYSVDVSPYSVRIQSDFGPQRRFAREEIVRAEESSWGGGIYLRTANRYRWLVIPRLLDGYGQLKDELIALGIPFTRKAIPTNWEEFVMILLFCGTMICDLVTHNRQILAANLIVAILVGIGGFLIISANPDSSPRMRWKRFVAFVPAVFSTIAFFR
jgi:hypothetical protein